MMAGGTVELKINIMDFNKFYDKLIYLDKLTDMECRPWVGSMSIVESMGVFTIFAGNGRNSKYLSFEKESFINEMVKAFDDAGYDISIVKRGNTVTV